MSVDADLSIKKVHLFQKKTYNSFKIEKIFVKTAQYCPTARVEEIFGVLWVNNCLW